MDLISRQAAIDALDTGLWGVEWDKALATAILKDLPSAERRGRWIDVEHAPDNLFYATCSVCGDRQTIEVANYCPMCGARMEASE